ncbi:MAG: hypothetical protein EHM56_12500 [Chloroflexi bacterium]|nr:MAG: hypothetical protein EHM56_12500 [Chloroflexota bacterium]
MERDRLGTVWAGLGLIGLGIAFVVAQWIGWDRIWPLFPVLGGIGFLAWYALTGFKDEGLVFVGIMALLVGLFFFGFTLGFWEWGQMGDLWPVFPLIGGVAFLALFFAERTRDVGTLGVGCAALIVGVVGLAFTYGLVGSDIWRFWPLLLILMGVLSLVGGLLRTSRRK